MVRMWLYKMLLAFHLIPRIKTKDGFQNLPSFDMYDDGNHLHVIIEAPGYNGGMLKAHGEGNVLRVTGINKVTAPGECIEQHIFSRGFNFPLDFNPHKVDLTAAKLTCKDGMLTVTVPKKMDITKKFTLAINASEE